MADLSFHTKANFPSRVLLNGQRVENLSETGHCKSQVPKKIDRFMRHPPSQNKRNQRGNHFAEAPSALEAQGDQLDSIEAELRNSSQARLEVLFWGGFGG